MPLWVSHQPIGTTSSLAGMHLEPAHDVSCPGSALHERQHEQDAHGEVLERVGEPVRYRVYGRSGSRVHGDDAAQDHGEADEQDQDDEPCDADGTEALQVPEPDLARLVEAKKCQRNRGERRHDVELYRARPADDERHDVCDEHDEPTDDRDNEQRQERRQVVIARYDRDRRHVQCAASTEEALHAVYRKAYDLVDGRHEVEGVLDQEKEYREEHEEEHHLLHAREGLVAVHALRDLDELQGEHEPEHAAADGQHRHLPDASGDVVHGHVSCAGEHGLERCRQHAVSAK